MDRNKGFTLIELMTVVAVIGVLVAIAIPSYQYYVGRSRVSAALVEIGILKKNYEIALNSSTDTPSLADIGADTLVSTQCVFAVSGQTAAGAVTVSCTLTNVPSSLSGGVLSYRRTEAGAWSCIGNASVNTSFLPTGCITGS